MLLAGTLSLVREFLEEKIALARAVLVRELPRPRYGCFGLIEFTDENRHELILSASRDA